MTQVHQKFPSLDPKQHDYTRPTLPTFTVWVGMPGEEELTEVTNTASGTSYMIYEAIDALFPDWNEISIRRNT